MDEQDAGSEVYQFDFIKSQSFKVIPVHGAWGGITPRGDFHLNLYSERPAIPRQVKNVVEDGKLGEEVSRVVRQGFIREVEVSCAMSPDVARAIHSWLGKKIAMLNALEEAAKKSKKKKKAKKKTKKSRRGNK